MESALQGQFAMLDDALRDVSRGRWLSLAGVVIGGALVASWTINHTQSFLISVTLHYSTQVVQFGLLLCGIAAIAATWANMLPRSKGHVRWLGGICLALAAFVFMVSPASASTHPVFGTPLGGTLRSRPAIQVELRSVGEFLGTAEVYLAVQSSRMPASTAVLFPVNVGDFQACRARFVQLPFEVEAGDTLLFNLLDDDSLGSEGERVITDAAEAAGYCLLVAGAAYRPDLARLLEPAFMSASRVLGDAVVWHFQNDPFEEFGFAEYIVQRSPPDQPHEANRLTITDGDIARADVRVYFPSHD